MSLRIVKAGVYDSVQDLGRYGYAFMGIHPGGVMDRMAAQLANMLVGNDPGTALLEMHFPAPEIRFEKPTLIALTGADVAAFVNGEPVAINSPVLLGEGTVLRFGKRKSGARIYLSVKQGFLLEPWLGSYSTNLYAGGRRLLKNDVIPFHPVASPVPGQSFRCFPWRANTESLYTSNPIRFVAGRQYSLLEEAASRALVTQACTITRESDRMGYRLKTTPLRLTHPVETISSAVTRGTIQLLPGQQLIILMADHQTTGGYPVVGHILSADLPTLAQKQAGDSFFLQKVTLRDAEAAMLQQQKDLRLLQNACTFRLHEYGLL